MKKITFIFLAFISIHASAETIQNQFLGFTLGKSKVDKLLEGKRVTVKYNLGAVNSPININESNKTFKYIEIE